MASEELRNGRDGFVYAVFVFILRSTLLVKSAGNVARTPGGTVLEGRWNPVSHERPPLKHEAAREARLGIQGFG